MYLVLYFVHTISYRFVGVVTLIKLIAVRNNPVKVCMYVCLLTVISQLQKNTFSWKVVQ